MELMRFLSAVLQLFSETLDAAFGVPVFRFFLVLLLFLSVLRFMASMVNQGRKGRL